MADRPPDWVLIEAAKRFGWNGVSEYLSAYYQNNDPPGFRAMCDMIQKYEQQPVDRKMACATSAATGYGFEPEDIAVFACCRAIELWEEGFGK
jgi:hypothetical protein